MLNRMIHGEDNFHPEVSVQMADHRLAVVLVHPEMPQNTGNIIRLCAAAGAALYLIKPLGFIWNEKKMRRAAMDYIEHAPIKIHVDMSTYRQSTEERHWLFSARAEKSLYDAEFQPGDRLVFGSESAGLPKSIKALYPDHLVRIPMQSSRRCLNLSSAAAIGLYEAIRQTDFHSGAAIDINRTINH